MLTDYAPREGIVTGGYGIREAVGRTTVGGRKHTASARINTNVPEAKYRSGVRVFYLKTKNKTKNAPLTLCRYTALHRVQQ